MLDTNAVSDLIRNPQGRVAQGLAATSQSVAVSVVVAAELRYGALRKGSPALIERVEGVLSRLDVAPLESPVDAVYARLRCDLERSGRPLGGNDLLIAAHAITLDRTLITADRALARTVGLTVENWLA